jgi:hypothetical protein
MSQRVEAPAAFRWLPDVAKWEAPAPPQLPLTRPLQKPRDPFPLHQTEAPSAVSIPQSRQVFRSRRPPQQVATPAGARAAPHCLRGHLRMVITYWDMAAGLIHNGAISQQLFNDTNGEHIGVFAKIEPLLGEIRAAIGRSLPRISRS